MWENVKNLWNHLIDRHKREHSLLSISVLLSLFLWDLSALGQAKSFMLSFFMRNHMISVFFQPNWLYLGLKTQLVWKQTKFMWENVKNLQNHVVGRHFVSLWKLRPTKWFCNFLTFSHMNSVFFQPNWLYFGLKHSIALKNNWNHVRKCQKLEKSRCRTTFFTTTKTLRVVITWLVRLKFFSFEFSDQIRGH